MLGESAFVSVSGFMSSKRPYKLRASGGYSAVEWRTKLTKVSRKEWAENGKEKEGGREHSMKPQCQFEHLDPIMLESALAQLGFPVK